MKFNLKYALTLVAIICLVAFIGEVNAGYWSLNSQGTAEYRKGEGRGGAEVYCYKGSLVWVVYTDTTELTYGLHTVQVNDMPVVAFAHQTHRLGGNYAKWNETLMTEALKGSINLQIKEEHMHLDNKEFKEIVLPTLKECYTWNYYTEH